MVNEIKLAHSQSKGHHIEEWYPELVVPSEIIRSTDFDRLTSDGRNLCANICARGELMQVTYKSKVKGFLYKKT